MYSLWMHEVREAFVVCCLYPKGWIFNEIMRQTWFNMLLLGCVLSKETKEEKEETDLCTGHHLPKCGILD